MKRWLIILSAVILSALGAQAEHPAWKQRLKLSCGLKLEANTSSLIHQRTEGVSTGMRAGMSAGGFLNLSISRLFSVQADLLLHYKNSFVEQDGTRGYNQYFGSEIPLYFMYHLQLKNRSGMFFGVGPFVEYGFKSVIRYCGKELDVYEVDPETGYSTMRDSNSGFAFLVGYEFPCGLQLNGGYKISVSNLLDSDHSRVALRPQTVSVGVAYRWK